MLPPYVYDLIAAIQEHEDVHGAGAPCFGNVLAAVPKQELDRAAAIAHYLKQPAHDDPPMPVRERIAATIEPQEFVVGDRTYRGFPVPPHGFDDAESTPEIQELRRLLGATMHDAVSYNEKYSLGTPHTFGINPADATRFGAWEDAAFWSPARIAACIAIVDGAVPAGWLRVHYDDKHRDVPLPTTTKA